MGALRDKIEKVVEDQTGKKIRPSRILCISQELLNLFGKKIKYKNIANEVDERESNCLKKLDL